MRARTASDPFSLNLEEYQRLWEFLTERIPPYLDYQKVAMRHIPIMIFERAN